MLQTKHSRFFKDTMQRKRRICIRCSIKLHLKSLNIRSVNDMKIKKGVIYRVKDISYAYDMYGKCIDDIRYIFTRDAIDTGLKYVNFIRFCKSPSTIKRDLTYCVVQSQSNGVFFKIKYKALDDTHHRIYNKVSVTERYIKKQNIKR